MKKELETRLQELKEEYKKGQEQLTSLNEETAKLGNTMLRISGAMQVLEELLEVKDSKKSVPAQSNGVELAKHI